MRGNLVSAASVSDSRRAALRELLRRRRIQRNQKEAQAADGAADDQDHPPSGAETKAPPLLFPLGHFYSPVCDVAELRARRAVLWPTTPRATPDIDWRAAEQLRLCEEVFATQEPLALRHDEPEDPTEYWCGNDQYPPMDAWILGAMLRHLQPRRVIEIGSGFSSLVTAQVNRADLSGKVRFTCIEPYPREYLRAGVEGISALRVEQVQDTPLSLFEELEASDIVFVDSSHTVKTGNDVTWIFHEIVPRLAPGVVVHIHDFFLPDEYPESWVMEGRGWNESYLVRSFLAYNDAFRVLWASRYMLKHHAAAVARAFPIDPDAHTPAGSLWFQRVR